MFTGNRLLGIILTGANEDGAVGLASVQDAGGITVVQEPATAAGAPDGGSALGAAAAGLVLPLDQIAALLQALHNHGQSASCRHR
jgi:two-component system chemotaxis response regulator CheB